MTDIHDHSGNNLKLAILLLVVNRLSGKNGQKLALSVNHFQATVDLPCFPRWR